MTSPIIDRGIIEILPDFSRFSLEYNAFLRNLDSTVSVNVKPNVDHSLFSKAGETAGKSFTDSVAKTIGDVSGLQTQSVKIFAAAATAGAPIVAAAISAAFAGAGITAGLVSAIAISAQDPRVKAVGTQLGNNLLSSLREAAAPFTEDLLRVMPKFGADVAALRPQLAGLFAPLGPLLDRLEGGAVKGISAAIPGLTEATQNSVKYVDALVEKMPQIGAAVGEFLKDVTDPAGVDFFKGIIDFVDKTLVVLGKFIQFLDEMGQKISGLATLVGGALGGALKLITGAFSALGPGGVDAIIGVAAAIYGVQKIAEIAGITFTKSATESRSFARAQTEASSAGARLALVSATEVRVQAEQLALQKSLTTAVNYGTVAAKEAAVAADRLSIAYAREAEAEAAVKGPGRFESIVSKLGAGAAVAGILAGSAITEAGHPVAGGIIAGAGTGALIGSTFGPEGTVVGAVAGGIAGGISGASSENASDADKFTVALSKLSSEYEKTGAVSRAFTDDLSKQSDVFKQLADHPKDFGTSVGAVANALTSKDPAAIQKQIDIQESHQESWWAKTFGSRKAGGAANFADELLPALREAKTEADAAAGGGDTLYTAWTADAHAAFLLSAQAADLAAKFANVNTAASNYSAAVADATNLAAPPEITGPVNALKAYDKGKQAISDAQYNQGTTQVSVNEANAAATMAVADAQHALTQSQVSVLDSQVAALATEKALTKARQDATDAIRGYRQELTGMADTEESNRIENENAKRTALAAGVYSGPIESAAQLIRDTAKVGLSQSNRGRADLLANDAAKAPELRTQIGLGVEGQPGVISAIQADNKSRLSVADSLYNQKKAHDAVTIAQQHQTDTAEAGRRQLVLAKRAIDEATSSLGPLAANFYAVLDAEHLTEEDVRTKLKPALDSVDRTFITNLETNGTDNARSRVSGVYSVLQQVASALGITLPNLVSSTAPFIGPVMSPSAGPGHPNIPGTTQRGLPTQGAFHVPSLFAAGGSIPGPYIGPTADNVLIRATPREFMQPVASVDYYGQGFHEAVRTRTFPREWAKGYAAGGSVGGQFNMLPTSTGIAWTQPSLAAALAVQKGIGTGSALSGVGAIQDWLKTTVDPLPYVLGSVGPGAYDCSGLVGEVIARLQGLPSYKRYFVTGGEKDFLTKHGFHSGAGQLTVGFSGEHTMGRLGGLSFEAANPRSGIHIGTGTSTVTDFPTVMGLDNLPGGAPPASSVTLKGLFGDALRSVLTGASEALASGGDSGDPGDANVSKIAAETGKAMGADYKAMLALFEAGLVESGMRNLLKAVDHDSLGYLQQRPSAGWPDPTNIATATHSFLRKAMGAEPWSGSAGSLAQRVQVSAYPGRYDQRQATAAALLAQYGVTADAGATLPPHSTTLVANNTSQSESVGFPLTSSQMRELAMLIAQALATHPAELRLRDETIIADKLVEPAIRKLISTAGMVR